jgi:hypothetical protein
MGLKVIGSGLGRTGTKSMQTALNMLGFGPCHHMVEVFANPDSIPLWIEAGAGRPQWDTIFANFDSVVDYPGAAFWRELNAYYPHAKVVHTIRDPDTWFDSTQATIFEPGRSAAAAAVSDGPRGDFFRVVTRGIGEHLHDRTFLTDYFRRHTENVVMAIPPQQLLIFEVGEGWKRLCDFLGVDVPDAPYPSENDRSEFLARSAAMKPA